MLELRDVTIGYGITEIVRQVSLHVKDRIITTLIGPNGAGKTTLVNGIAGLIGLKSGEIWFRERKIDELDTYERVSLGISIVPEGKGLFPYLSVVDNLKMGAYLKNKNGMPLKEALEEVYTSFPVLKERRTQAAGLLSGGEQQMLAIARALMRSMELLVLDEITLGLAPLLAKECGNIIRRLNQRGKTILLVEQNAAFAFDLAVWAYVLEMGRIVKEGESSYLKDDIAIRQAYLGA